MAMPVPTPHNMIPKRRMDDEERLIEKLSSNWFLYHMKTKLPKDQKRYINITYIIYGNKKHRYLVYNNIL